MNTMGKKNILTKAKKARAEQLALGNHLTEAQVLFASVCKTDPLDVEAWVKRAVIQCRLGQYIEAESFARRALLLAPKLAFAQETLATILKYQGKFDAASAVLEAGLAQSPNSPEHLINLATMRDKQGRVEEAYKLFHRALDLQPGTAYVLAKQADLLEKEGRLKESADIIARSLAREPRHPELNLVAARLDRREGRLAEAVARLETVLHLPMSPDTGAEIHILLGQLCDLLGDTGKVLPHLLEGKRRLARDMDPHGTIRARFLAWIDTNHARSNGNPVAAPQATPATLEETPVFVIGFLRSGTTLLEQILDCHPRVQALSEKPMGELMEDAFCVMTRGKADPLVNLSDEQIVSLRQIYWQEAGRHIDRQADAVLVDKQPLNLVRVPLLKRVFPHARFIFTMRHPCDVVLGCMMQKFGYNNPMSTFADLQGLAELYSRVMNAWIDYTQRLPLSWQGIRYEDLVANFEPEVRKLLEFLGLDWDEKILDHTQHSQQRGIINTPSYHQVTQPVYQHARYRWKRYEKAFVPVMDTLRPFIDHFGYGEDDQAIPAADACDRIASATPGSGF
jgi:tetratricopeptide (TPR) repeat protein